MSDWKKGKLVDIGGGGFQLRDKHDNVVEGKAKNIRKINPDLFGQMQGAGEMTVFYQYSRRQLLKITGKEPEDYEKPATEKVSKIVDSGNLDRDLTYFPPPQDISRSEKGDAELGAFSPYNFVRLPQKPLMARWDDNSPTYSGEIRCRLINKEPLFIRDGRLGDEPAQETFHLGSEENPMIPGTTIKGALRAIIEAATGNGYDRVQPRHFFVRDMGRGNNYTRMFLNIRNGRFLVKAGFLCKINDKFFIQPCEWAKLWINDIPSHMRIHSRDASSLITNKKDRDTFKCYNGLKINFKNIKKGSYQVAHRQLEFNQIDGFLKGTRDGWLVFSGPMGSKKYEFVFYNREADKKKWLPIDKEKVEAFEADLTDFKEAVFGEKLKLTGTDGIPVFYLEEKQPGKPYFFGRAQMFRVPYTYNLVHYVPDEFRGAARKTAETAYFCEKLFGALNMLPQKKNRKEEQLAVAGRVSVSPAKYQGRLHGDDNISQESPEYLVQQPRYLKTLNSPKPSSYQLYLEQKDGKPLADYFTNPKTGKRIAGHKFYWHKPGSSTNIFANEDEQNPNVQTKAKPLSSGHVFEFTIGIDRLTEKELGAVLWALKPWPESCWKIGGGKPLGMGTVDIRIIQTKIDKDDGSRYRSLLPFVKKSGKDDILVRQAVGSFREFVADELGNNFDRLPHLQDLRALLDYTKRDSKTGKKRYMDINDRHGEARLWRDKKIMPGAKDFYSG